MAFQKKFMAYIENGSAGNAPETVLPSEILKAKTLWDKQGEEAGDKIAALLAKYLSGNFVPGNIPALEGRLASMDDIAATSIEVTGFDFDILPPRVDVEGIFTLAFREDTNGEDLQEWQEDEEEFLRDCVTFYWTFGDYKKNWDGNITDDEGGGMDMVEE